MGYVSTVPAAVARLLSDFAVAPGLAGVEVRDGPQAPDTSATEAVYVGYTGDDALDAVEVQASPEGLGGLEEREQYTVHCSVMVLNQDGDVAAARARAYELQSFCGAAVIADNKLGGLVMRATFGAGALRQMQTANGMKVYVLFDVDVDSYTGR